jgi:tRNA(fMet)-specific endonuclease VapC
MSLLLLDTSAYSAFGRGDAAARERIASARELALSVVVMGELLHGFRVGRRFEENRRQLDQFRSDPRVRTVVVGIETAHRFSRVMAELRRAGTPIPTNDAWIAAQALEIGAEVLTFDSGFERVPGLAVTRLTR